MELQELVSRARLIFVGAPRRLEIYGLVNGRRSASEIAQIARRPQTAVLHDLQKMKSMEVIILKRDRTGREVKKEGSVVLEKNTLLKHISQSYFKKPEKIVAQAKKVATKKGKKSLTPLPLPSAQEIIDACASGEDQLHEFKEAGVEMSKLAKEICAFANTRGGGFIFYGVDDAGQVLGSDKSRQSFDQSLQNSVKSNISPALHVRIAEKDVLGNKIIIIAIPPRDTSEVYHCNNVVYIRKGTNAFAASTDEVKKLYSGKNII